jgi:uncharacterized membrane protein
MKKAVSILSAAGLGAGLMFLLDPDRGNRRRAMMRDKAVHAANVMVAGVSRVWRDATNRSRGMLAERARFFRRETPDDRTLAARVRSEMGTLVQHPRAIEVSVENGQVTLRGPIRAQEVEALLSHVEHVRGVTSVKNDLDIHESTAGIPALQGASRAPRQGQQAHWSSTARFTAGTAGGAMVLYGLWRKNALTAVGGLAGSALVARAASNLPFKRLVGVGAGRRAMDFRKTMTIAAPRPRVFGFWSRYADFPRYMRHVLDIRNLGEGRSRWKVLGPAGMQLVWVSVITDSRPNKLLAWKTEPGSALQHAGVLRFMDSHDGGTIIHMHVSYNPPGGALGHGMAKAVAGDLESLIDEEFVRIKTFLEKEPVSPGAQGAEESRS